MRFGGHETFAVREGWLHKGLGMVHDEPEKLVDEYAADWLGVGQNMAKSIRHWLLATGLAEKSASPKGRQVARLQPTALGHLVRRHDPHFTAAGTWWAVHAALLASTEHAYAWGWFFNTFSLARFDKGVCLEALIRHLQARKVRMPAQRTLERDLRCLFSSYARAIPAEPADPEEARESPFAELGLLSFYRASGYYQLQQGGKDAPWQLIGYIVNSTPDTTGPTEYLDVPIQDAARRPGSAGRVLCMGPEALYEAVVRAEAVSDGAIQIAGLAGERRLRARRSPPGEWLRSYYLSVGLEARDAA